MSEFNNTGHDSLTSNSRRLSMMLAGLAIALRLNSWFNPAFREHLKEGRWVLQVRTEDGRVCRHFVFQAGRFSSRASVHPSPDFEQVWVQAADAVFALPHPDRTELLRANENGRVRFYGEALAALYFTEALELQRLGFQRLLQRLRIGNGQKQETV